MYRWKIPSEFKEEFFNNWIELTEQVKQQYGLYTATLYACNNEFVSVTQWPNEESWQAWITELKNHPYRNRWREYRVAGPDRLELITEISEEIKGA